MSGTIPRVEIVDPETSERFTVEEVLQKAREENQHVAFFPEGKIFVGDVHDVAVRYAELLLEVIKEKLTADSLSGSETSEELAQGIALMGLDVLAKRVAIGALFGTGWYEEADDEAAVENSKEVEE